MAKAQGRAEVVKGTLVRFTCPHGHTQVEDLGRRLRIDAATVANLAADWSTKGVIYRCKHCTREEREALRGLPKPSSARRARCPK